MAGVKFATRMFLPATVLILLSVSTSAEDARRCYWCGPLAEQVHRSQRAPSCGQDLQETMCDPGHTHCAIVATSPPYVESRLCVKFYQDECYSLYCNSSKTWRMICPCQGNLCNGQNSDRETMAFATLAKIVGKNKRSKRCLVGVNKGFLPLTPRKKVFDENNTIVTPLNETHSTMQSEEPTDEHFETMQTTSIMNDVLEEHGSENDVGNNIEEDTNVKQDSESEMQGDQPIEINEAVTTPEVTKNLDKTANVEQSETTKTIDAIKMNSVASTIVMLEENNDEDIKTVTIPAEFIKETQENTEIPTLTSMLPTSIEIELSVVHIKNPNDNLPPPEALQQNVTPAKVASPTTMETIEMITNTNHIETTTHSIKEITENNDQTQEIKKKNSDTKEMDKKNGEEQTLAHLWELVILMNILIYLTL